MLGQYSVFKVFKFVCLCGFCLLSPIKGSCQVVTLLELDWSSQQVLTHALSSLLIKQGVDTQIMKIPASGQWYCLATSKADIQVEVWEGTMARDLDKLLKQNRVAVAAEHNVSSREGWWFPSFVKELCPGLPDWKALNDCWSLFADGGRRGVYYAGPWEKPDAARIRALGLPFMVNTLDTGEELKDLLVEAIDKRQPILLFNWSPNWVDKAFEGQFVDFPTYEPECETKPEWGVNEKYPWDCDNPVGGWLKTVVSTDLAKKSSCAYKIVQSFILNHEDLSLAGYLTDVKGLSVADAAQSWLETNASRQPTWLTHQECN